MKYPNPDEVEWLLLNIKYLDEWSQTNPSHRPNRQNIWRGSYDVWTCEQDKIDAIEIPKRRMKEAEEAGLITSEETLYRGKYKEIVWKLTGLGRQRLEALER